MKKIYFGSDFHFFHENVIKFDKRPFKSVQEMNDIIIKNCLKLFKPDDEFYFDGDWALRASKEEMESIFETFRSSGVKMFFIKGNHDHSDTRKLYAKFGTYLGDRAEIEINGQRIVIDHYPMEVWNKSHFGSWHLYGHCHHSLPDNPNMLRIDLGINGKSYNYTPIEFNQIAKMMSHKQFKPVDHHGTRGETH